MQAVRGQCQRPREDANQGTHPSRDRFRGERWGLQSPTRENAPDELANVRRFTAEDGGDARASLHREARAISIGAIGDATASRVLADPSQCKKLPEQGMRENPGKETPSPRTSFTGSLVERSRSKGARIRARKVRGRGDPTWTVGSTTSLLVARRACRTARAPLARASDDGATAEATRCRAHASRPFLLS